ncbi:MAG: DUF4350 domain-containing protein [Verrucomicrobiales bacterium]
MRFFWLFGLLFFLLTGCQGRWEKEEIVLGYRGEARLNPYLAAQRYLATERSGEVRSERSLLALDESVEVLILPVEFLSTRLSGERLLPWIAEGGRLVLLMQGGLSTFDDFSEHSQDSAEHRGVEHLELPGLDFLKEKLEVGVTEAGTERAEEVSVADEEAPGGREFTLVHSTELGPEHRFEVEGKLRLRDLSAAAEEEADVALLRSFWGDGELIWLSHARPLRSAYLDRAGHAELLRALAGEDFGGDLLFVYGTGLSLWGMLMTHAWRVLLVLALFLLLLLWNHLPRFGPLIEEREGENRRYGEQLLAGTRFLWRNKLMPELLKRVRSRAVPEGEKIDLLALSRASGLAEEEVAACLERTDIRDEATLIQHVSQLKQLQKKREL